MVDVDQDQQKWLKGFSRVGFFLPIIYLLWARQYLYFGIIFILYFLINFDFGISLLSTIASVGLLVASIFVGIKGRNWAFAKTKKSFEDFKAGYRKFSKIIFYIFLPLLGIVMIGIFVAALLPRLSGVQGRARDVARKSAIQQVASALIMHQIDSGTYPHIGGSLDTMQDIFADSLTSIPGDPYQNASFNGLINIPGTPGQYMYIPLNKNGTITEGFALVAKTETEGGSNRVFDKKLPIEAMTDVDSVKICDTLTQSSYTKNINDGACYYENTDDLAYVYIYKLGLSN